MSDPNSEANRFSPSPQAEPTPSWDAPPTPPGYGTPPSYGANPAPNGFPSPPQFPAGGQQVPPTMGAPDNQPFPAGGNAPGTGFPPPQSGPGYPMPPGYTAAPPQGGWTPAGPVAPVIPLRPLSLGDLFSGTFAAIRSNPKVMFTISLGVMAVVGVLTAIIDAVVMIGVPSWTDLLQSGPDALESMIYDSGFAYLLPTSLVQTVMSLVQAAASLLVAGMLVLAVTNAVVDGNRDLQGTWEQLKPRFWSLVGTALLVYLIMLGVGVATVLLVALLIGLAFASSAVVVGVFAILLLVPATIALLIWLAVRLYFATMISVVEGASPVTALGRSWKLTGGAFWRCFGRFALLVLVMGVIMGILSGIVSAIIVLITGFAPVWIGSAISALVLALLSGLALPVSGSYTALMYVDERMRSEGLAPRLQAALDENRAAQARF